MSIKQRLKIAEGWHDGNRCPSCGCPRDPLGIATIGWGRNLRDQGITRAEGEILLQNDIDARLVALTRHYGRFGELTQARQDVLIEMAYNVGLAGLFGFRKMWAAIERGDDPEVAVQILDSKAARDLPGRYKWLADQWLMG